ncbi:uncharacterized protein LOC119656214 isoform X2 [Hermetia illucens]|nr:uncharacterized protein LOC119656214 isoform X2 [Hermetia illucens]
MSSTVAPPALTITSVSSAGTLAPMSSVNVPAQLQLQPQQQGAGRRFDVNPVSVKQERHDEAEIQEMANKFREAQKAALAKQSQQQQLIGGRNIPASTTNPMASQPNGQTNILNYLTRRSPQTVIGAAGSVSTPSISTNGQVHGVNSATNGKSSGTVVTTAVSSTANSVDNNTDKKTCDEESQKGHFGWVTFGKIYIPYIVRQNEKYCAVRMVEMKLLNKYLSYLHPDIYSSCTCVRSYYITEAESRLLNEINHKHCDAQFGREMFTLKDLVVRLSDANKFYQFLDICYRKLVTGSKSPSDKCGFIRINKESVVPYTVRANEQVVPLFYFEGETENLRQKAELLSGWDLAYLKFCCKVQGIRNELFSSESVAVISLTDIKSYFPTGTEFEDYWPSKVVDSNLLIASKNINNSVHWTRQPTAPPVTPKILNAAPKNSQQQQQQIRKNAYQTGVANQNVQRMHQAAAAASMAIPQTGLSSAAVQAWSLAYAQGALRAGETLAQNDAQQQVQRGYTAHNANAAQNIQNLQSLMTARQQYNYNTRGMAIPTMNNCAQSPQPPPLVRSAGQNQTHMSNTAANVVLQQQQQQRQQQIQQQQQQLQRLNTMQNGRSSQSTASNTMQRHTSNTPAASVADVLDTNLRIIPEITTQSNTVPYKVQKVFVFEDTLVPCINMKAYNDSEPLMTLTDFRECFFPSVPWNHCKRLIEALGVEMYKGNRRQTLALIESGKNHNESIPLIQVRDVIKYMPQLRYMMRSSPMGQEQPPNKRTRIS